MIIAVSIDRSATDEGTEPGREIAVPSTAAAPTRFGTLSALRVYSCRWSIHALPGPRREIGTRGQESMKPNIGRAGRIARAISGTLCVLGGVACMVFSWPEAVLWRWVLAVLLIGFGVFQWYEAKRRWCVVRACGIRTPM